MKVVAVSKGVRQSPRKVSVVASLVRGRSVEDALSILEFTPRRSALAVSKTIKSAAANATHNHNVKSGGLYIAEISVTPGPSLKRYRPASHGRALPFERKSSHIRVVVEGEIRESKPKVEKAKSTAVQSKAKKNTTGDKE